MSPAPAGPPASSTALGLSGASQPLEPGVRDLLSTSFGHDFSPVRIHAGPEAAQATRETGALAYTVGHDVVFSAGNYDPLTSRGRGLIAHELAHVAQHRGRAYAPNFLVAHPTASVPVADRRLERQAHTAARLAGGGTRLPANWAWEKARSPFVGRTETTPSGWAAPPAPYDVEYAGGSRTITSEQWSAEDPAVARINLGEFRVPQRKGPWAAEYDRIARAGGLQATIAVDPARRIRADMWQQRAPTSQLRNLWLLRVGWTAAQAAQWWHDAGGTASAGGAFSPATSGGSAQIDHVVELQLGGTNVPENLAPHTGPDNEASGREIWAMMRGAAQSAATQITGRPGGRALRSLSLSFSSAAQDGAYENASALAALPQAADARDAVIAARRGTAVTALQVHFTALADSVAGTRPSAEDRSAAAAAVAALSEYPLAAGPSTATLRVPATPGSQPDLIENSEVPANHAARELISGLALAHLTRPVRERGAHVIEGWLGDDEKHPARAGTRIPLSLRSEADKKIALRVTQPGGVLRLQGGTKRLSFTYPYLSAGTLDLTTDDVGNLTGHGSLIPSVPLLRRVPITVDWDSQGFRGSVQAPTDQLSLPPFRITEAALTVNLAPELSAGGHVAFELGRHAQGRIEAGADAQGFFARGNVTATIPGLDAAEGRVEYRPATGLSGFVVVHASRPSGLVRSGEARFDFTRTGWTVGGQVDVMLPGDSPAQLTVRKDGERIIYAGRATLNVPGLRPVDVALRYDGERLSGTARTTFTVLGANGEMELRYREGRFSGTGSIALQRGRFSGRLEATMDQQGRLSGRGTGSLVIRPGLVATIGIEYGTDRRLKTTGELRFPPYRFLEPRGNRYQLFQRSLPDIPLFAIPTPIGSVGLVARIGGGMAAHYRFGPGEIRDMVIRATLYPLEDDLQAELSASARLVLPAEAGLELSVRAGIGASVAIASATGGITVTGGVVLRGGLDASASLTYARDLLTFDARARIQVEPVLTLRIEADVMIEAVAAGPWRWPYELASYSYPTGLTFGMVAPFSYRSDQALRLPSASDIEWIVPQIDVAALATQIGGQVRRGIGF
ncbi:hypothetical protein GCM10027020_06170 [Nocardioides salsibiostraticola]